ncbi:major facilitator superfamily domain-containing protein [Halenospora varia]|nr:major facilitator superfamily domain-containing protein [Halenospora varia]
MAAPATESEPHATRDEEKISPSEHSKEEGVVASKSIDHEREKEIVNIERDTAGPIVKVDSYKDEKHINLTWRSWMVVFVTCFAVFAQVYVVVAAGSVIGFIIRDLGDPAIAGWIIQGPLLMQSVLSPIIGRLSDVLDRKWLAIILTCISFIGAVVSAKAQSMSVLIGGGILVGCTLSTIAIVQAIPSEVLPLKYRAIANGFAGIAGGLGGVVGNLGAGGVTNVNASGWRNIFWIQAGFFALTVLGLFFFYNPKKESDFPKMSMKNLIWACDPIGSVLFIVSATLMLLALDWAGGVYKWHDAHVVAPLTVGLVALVAFCAYEWKGRDDGLVAHVFFRSGPNFPLSVGAFAIEGWIFYSAVNSITPLVVLNLGFEDTAWHISVRQLSFNLTLLGLIPLIMWYSTARKDLKTPILVGFGFFLVVTICYACITPSMNKAQLGFNILSGIGQSMPLTLLVAVVQFTSPHAYLSTATGLAFSARALGGAFGSAILNTIINSKIASDYAPKVSSAALKAGLPESSIPALLKAFATGEGFAKIPGADGGILKAATDASHLVYAAAYRLAWSSIIPFVVLALVAVWFLRGVKELMTEHVEATVEREGEEQSAA